MLYEKGSLKRKESGGQYYLWSDKEIEEGRKRSNLFFAGFLVQKGYVGFYHMPIYTHPDMKKNLKPELLKCLNGKSGFHVTRLDNELKAQIKEALKAGYGCNDKMGWV